MRGWFQVFDAAMIRTPCWTIFDQPSKRLTIPGIRPMGWHRADPVDLAEATFFDIHQEKHFSHDYTSRSPRFGLHAVSGVIKRLVR